MTFEAVEHFSNPACHLAIIFVVVGNYYSGIVDNLSAYIGIFLKK